MNDVSFQYKPLLGAVFIGSELVGLSRLSFQGLVILWFPINNNS